MFAFLAVNKVSCKFSKLPAKHNLLSVDYLVSIQLHNGGTPFIILLKLGNFYKLSSGRLKHGENGTACADPVLPLLHTHTHTDICIVSIIADREGLKRKLTSKLGCTVEEKIPD